MSRSPHPLDLLVVSDVWPPLYVGGYELGAADLCARLAERGHRVTVLTSTYGLAAPRTDGEVHRLLFEQVQHEPLTARRLVTEALAARRGLAAARRFLAGACFDLVYLLNPLGLSATLVQALGATGRPLVAYVSDNWVAQWPYCDRLLAQWLAPRPDRPLGRDLGFLLLRHLFARLGVLTRNPDHLPIRHAQFVSRFVQRISRPRLAGLATQEVIPWGIDVARFPFRERRPDELGEWVFVGQLEEHKGPQTAVEAVALLRARGHPVRLTLFGDDSRPLGARLRRRVAEAGLGEAVVFAGRQPRERLWAAAHDRGGVLVFPTLWDEPFSITLLEAFAAGIPVLATVTGGSAEIVRDGETATVFRGGDAGDLASRWLELGRAPERALASARRARAIVERHLDIERMADAVEAHLVAVVEGRGTTGPEEPAAHRHPWEPPDAER